MQSSSAVEGGGPDPAVMAAIERGNAVCFLDVALGEGDNMSELGRIKLELFVKDVSSVQSSRVHVQFSEQDDFCFGGLFLF